MIHWVNFELLLFVRCSALFYSTIETHIQSGNDKESHSSQWNTPSFLLYFFIKIIFHIKRQPSMGESARQRISLHTVQLHRLKPTCIWLTWISCRPAQREEMKEWLSVHCHSSNPISIFFLLEGHFLAWLSLFLHFFSFSCCLSVSYISYMLIPVGSSIWL